MKKVFKVLILIFLVLFGIGIFFQIKVELYKQKLIDSYNFRYLRNKRSRYTPFVVFFLESKIIKKNKCYFANINLPYQEYEKIMSIRRIPHSEYTLVYNIEYNAYLMYCYYNINDLNCNMVKEN